jgi:hypothetical protein
VKLPQLGPREPVEESCQENAVRWHDARPVDLPLQDDRTVGAHLYQIYPKLGIASRVALRDALRQKDAD